MVRICAGLRQAVASLDEVNAATMRRRIDNVSAAIGLLSESVSDTEDGTGQTARPARPLAGNARHHDRPN